MAQSLAANQLFSIAGKVAVVTGGGRGIGKMIADTFVQNNATVFIASRTKEACEATAAELNGRGPGKCIPLIADLGTEAGCKNLAEQIRAQTDRVHILVNNSGTAFGAPLDRYPDIAWDKVYALNVKAIFQLTRACLPMLDLGSAVDDPARVINVGSIAGLQPQPVPTYAYDASKAAVHMLTRKLAADFADRRAKGGHSITVNAIAPGIVPSKMSQQLLTYVPAEKIAASVPLRRMGCAGDVGGAALYLASRAGSWITGVTLPVDGGAINAVPFRMMPDAEL